MRWLRFYARIFCPLMGALSLVSGLSCAFTLIERAAAFFLLLHDAVGIAAGLHLRMRTRPFPCSFRGFFHRDGSFAGDSCLFSPWESLFRSASEPAASVSCLLFLRCRFSLFVFSVFPPQFLLSLETERLFFRDPKKFCRICPAAASSRRLLCLFLCSGCISCFNADNRLYCLIFPHERSFLWNCWKPARSLPSMP